MLGLEYSIAFIVVVDQYFLVGYFKRIAMVN